MKLTIAVFFLLETIINSFHTTHLCQSNRAIAAHNSFTDFEGPITNTGIKNDILKSLIGVSVIACSLIHPPISYADDSLPIQKIKIEYDGESRELENYLGSKCSLVVNVASQCALTPQYEELVDLFNEFQDKGFTILAFPCNQFGSQEPAPVKNIRRDMFNEYGVKFKIFDKIDVNGPNTHPLYARLKSYKDIGVSNINKISWNFEKFLVNSDGVPIRRYKPSVRPSFIRGDILSYITKSVLPVKEKPSLNNY